jgi:hypothetical protein
VQVYSPILQARLYLEPYFSAFRWPQRIGTAIEFTGRRKDESEFPVEIMLSPLDSSEAVLVTTATLMQVKRANEMRG